MTPNVKAIVERAVGYWRHRIPGADEANLRAEFTAVAEAVPDSGQRYGHTVYLAVLSRASKLRQAAVERRVKGQASPYQNEVATNATSRPAGNWNPMPVEPPPVFATVAKMLRIGRAATDKGLSVEPARASAADSSATQSADHSATRTGVQVQSKAKEGLSPDRPSPARRSTVPAGTVAPAVQLVRGDHLPPPTAPRRPGVLPLFGTRPAAATTALPGTSAKLAELRRRLAAGESAWSAADAGAQ